MRFDAFVQCQRMNVLDSEFNSRPNEIDPEGDHTKEKIRIIFLNLNIYPRYY